MRATNHLPPTENLLLIKFSAPETLTVLTFSCSKHFRSEKINMCHLHKTRERERWGKSCLNQDLCAALLKNYLNILLNEDFSEKYI